MRSSELFRKLSGVSTSTSLRHSLARPRYRCLHSSQRLREEKSPKKKDAGDDHTATPYSDHLIPENELSVRHAKPKRKYAPRSKRGLNQYSRDELLQLKEKYTPAQMAALMAGEESISLQDVADQAVIHSGPMTLNYLDDFSQHRPAVDKNPEVPSLRDPKTGKMPKFRWKNDHEIVDDLEDWLDEQPDDGGDPKNWERFINNYKVYDSDVDLDKAPTSEAPELFPMDDPIMKAQARASKAMNGGDEMTEEYITLAKRTGFSMAQIENLAIKVLVYRLVSNQTRLGKRPQVYYITAAGDGAGMLGIGEAKSEEPGDARKKSILNAIRNIRPIPRYEGRTIYGKVKGKSGATELELSARHPGFGSRGQSLIWEICRMVGIKDISARVTRSRNPMNIVKATYNALISQQDPEKVALGRGRRMVDLRKVYYAGGNA